MVKKQKSVTRFEIRELLNDLYNAGFLVITEAGIRLTYRFLWRYMKNPMYALQQVEDYFAGNSSSNSSSTITTITIARDIVESICYLLIGSKIRKWVSLPELYQELRRRGYTITTTCDTHAEG